MRWVPRPRLRRGCHIQLFFLYTYHGVTLMCPFATRGARSWPQPLRKQGLMLCEMQAHCPNIMMSLKSRPSLPRGYIGMTDCPCCIVWQYPHQRKHARCTRGVRFAAIPCMRAVSISCRAFRPVRIDDGGRKRRSQTNSPTNQVDGKPLNQSSGRPANRSTNQRNIPSARAG